MSPRGPFVVHPYSFQGHGGHPFLHLLVLLAVVALLIAGGIWLFRRLSPRQAGVATLAPAGAPGGADPLGIVRLRYARGEIGREEFQRLSVDLGAAPDTFGPASAASEAPTQAG
jgi:uncharacterized membrane protein